MIHAVLEDNTFYPVPTIKIATDKKKLEVRLNKNGVLALKEMLHMHVIEYLFWKLSAIKWQKSKLQKNIWYPDMSKDDGRMKSFGVNP